MSDGIDLTDIVINPGEVKVIGALNVIGPIFTGGVVTANDIVVGGLLSLQNLSDSLNREKLTRESNETILQNRVSALESPNNVDRGFFPILNVVPMLAFPGTIPGVPTPGVPLYQPQEGLRISPNEIEFGMFKFDESGNVANFTPEIALLKSLQQLQKDVAAIKAHLKL